MHLSRLAACLIAALESMQSSGDSRCGGGFNVSIDGAKVGIAPLERAFKGFVQDGNAHVEERLYCPSVPAHLLLLDHPARHDFIHRTLDERGRDGFAVTPAGLGRMGSALASNLLQDGLNLVVFDRSLETKRPFTQKGVAVADALSDLRDCDVVLTSLPDDSALSAVTLDKSGLLDVLRTGVVHLSMSTISPDLAVQLQVKHAASGQIFLSAPAYSIARRLHATLRT